MCRGKWKTIAWNGICFNAPGSWEIGQLGDRHLMLENDAGPAMEVKWGPVSGKFSHQAHLKRLGAFQSRKLKNTVKDWFLPPVWEKALTGFQTRGFSWQTETQSGRGVILHCPVCRNAALIQFLQPKSTRSEKIPLEVLQTFQDHREDDQIAWSVFDIRAMMPANFELVRHRFEPGNYELAFEQGSQKIFLYRWAPASVLLSGQDLSQFARMISDFSAADPVPLSIEGGQAVELSFSPRFIWLSRFRARPSFHWMGLWHLESKNRILGVKMQGKKAFDTQMLDRICSEYDSL